MASLILASLFPVQVLAWTSPSAIPGKDEKNFSNPTTRCMTASIKALHTQTVNQMNEDIAKYGAGHAAAVNRYKLNVEILWAAMQQPYCGYGAYGLTAVQKGFVKTVSHVRSSFLASVKT